MSSISLVYATTTLSSFFPKSYFISGCSVILLLPAYFFPSSLIYFALSMSIFVLFPSLDFSISATLYCFLFIHGLVVVLTASLIVVGEVLFLSSY
jgi:hypothetical protein